MTYSREKFYEAVWKIVSSISIGRVMSYGEVARAAGYPRYARMVSNAMGRSVRPLPWHRVVKSNRTLAFEAGSKQYNKQRELLEKEGVQVVRGKVIPAGLDENKSLDKALWGPPE